MVYLSEIMPLEVNHGYETWKNMIAVAVNGVCFANVGEMKSLIDAIEDGFIEIKLSKGPPLVLDADKCKESVLELKEKYNLNTHCSRDLLGDAVWPSSKKRKAGQAC